MTQPRRVPATLAGALIGALALAAPGAAQIYKWTDEKGTVHFSNDPPPRAAVEELPETQHRPLVTGGPPPPGGAEAEPATDEAPRVPGRRIAVEHAPEEDEAEELVVEDEPDVIIVDDGQPDLVTRYRANSPRNRPGQPIRQPVQQAPRRRR